jgi:hypothetical protein
MSADLDGLVASPWWEWLPGMAGEYPGIPGVQIRCGSSFRGTDARPDIDDPATQGCMLALVRKAYGHGPTRDVNIERVDDGRYCLAVLVFDQGIWRYDDTVHDAWNGSHRTRPTVADLARDTYGQALAAALLASPAPEIGP